MASAGIADLLSVNQVEAAKRALADGKTLPYSFYGDPNIHKFDLETIYKPSWQAICAASSVEELGSTFTCRLGDIPVVIVRDDKRILRGFVNVCRHRGYPVVRKNGRAGRLTCRYHSWTYSLDGALINSPETSQDEQDAFKCLSLLPVSVTEWRGCVFAHLDPHAEPLSVYFANLDDVAEECSFDLSDYHWIKRLDLIIQTDWKLFYDNSVECYHCPSMHSRTLNTLYEARSFDDIKWHGHIRKAQAQLKNSDQEHHTIQLFPGTYLVMDPVIGIVGRFYPSGPGQTKLEFHFLAPATSAKCESEHFAEIWCQTMREDCEIVEAQADGFKAIDHGYFVSKPEASVIGVQLLILDAYLQAVSPKIQTNGKADAIVS